METLIFLLVILNTNLVLCDDNVAIESGVGYQVHVPPEETSPENDQQAESSHVLSHTYGQSVQGAASLKDAQAMRQSHDETLKYSDVNHLSRNGDVRYTYEVQNVRDQPEQQTVQYLHGNIRNKPIVVNTEPVRSVPSQIYSRQQQQIGVQQYPTHQVQIYDAQASPLQQVYENEHAIGYQTYVEHGPEAEDEEIKSALKENSLGDIKRLVPKSGISFKVYHNEKAPSVKINEQKVEIEPVVSTISTQATQKEFLNSVLHHRVRVQAPAQQLQIQTSRTHQLPEVDKPHQIYGQENIGEHQTLGNHLSVGNILHEGQNQNTKIYYTQEEVSSPRPVAYTQPEISSLRPVLEITGKNAAGSPYKIKLRDDHARATSTVEFNKNTGSGGLRQDKDSSHLRHQESRKNFHKTFKQLKPGNVHYQKELAEGVEKLAVSHNGGLGSVISQEESSLYSGGFEDSGKVIAHQLTPQGQLLHGKTFADSKTGQPILNRLSGTYVNEGIKSGSAVSHLGTSGYSESQYKNTRSNLGSIYLDNEGAKTQDSSVSHVAQFDANSSPNNFDHQKALEGSTSFDIKNAIGNTDDIGIQGGYVSTTEIHPTEQVQKQQLVYGLPSVPTVLIENNILKTGVEGHQIKPLGQVTSIPQFAYHPQEMGKFYRQPQFVWTSEQFKQGTELHQPLIKLHIPKEEIQYVKTPKVEIPSIITHQHQSFLGLQNAPYKPHHGLHFQLKKHPQGHQTHLKPVIQSQPVIIDWSLFKSKFPNVNINSLVAKPELIPYMQDPTKKVMPILVKKRKNRSNNKEVGVVYGKASSKGPTKPNQRQEKNVHVNLVPSASNDVSQYEAKGERKKEFSVSASYKVDRSYKSS